MTTDIIIENNKIKSETVRLVLPLPPSVNHYWTTFKSKSGKLSRGRSKRATRFGTRAQMAVLTQGNPAYGNHLVVVDMFIHHSGRGGDVDNYSKGILDALTRCGVWDDDDQVIRLAQSVRGRVPNGCVIVEIRLASDDEIRWSSEVMPEAERRGEYGL